MTSSDSLNIIVHNFCIVIVICQFLKRHSKIKRIAPAYSRALLKIRGVVQSVVRSRFRSGFQRVRGDRVAVKADVVWGKSEKTRGSDESVYELLKRLHFNF